MYRQMCVFLKVKKKHHASYLRLAISYVVLDGDDNEMYLQNLTEFGFVRSRCG